MEPSPLPSYCFTYCDQQCIEDTIAYEFALSLTFSVFALLVSAYHIFMHLHNFNNPFFQSKIIGIPLSTQSSSSWRLSTASPPWAPSSSQ
jgi:hypothetical protein